MLPVRVCRIFETRRMVEEVCLVQGHGCFGLGVDKRTANYCSFMAVFARSFLLIATIILLFGQGQLGAVAPPSARGIYGEVLTGDQMRGAVLSSTRFDYPIEARRARISGSGIFEARIDPKTGRIKGILVVQSTGSQILDWAVVRALSRWRFKPGVVTAFRQPVEFSISMSRIY